MIFKTSHLTLFRDQTLIVEDFSFTANATSVVGIIGDNGSGKTSLLLAFHGVLPVQEGYVQATRTEMVEQDILATYGNDTISEWLADLEQWQVAYIIELAQITASLDELIFNLSGGERTRLAIAYAFRPWEKAEAILMDEPTNNLDFEGIQWLVGMIEKYDGIIFIVSHDRTFLNKVCDKILFLEQGKATEYAGNYDDFKNQWVHARETQHRQYADSTKRQQLLKVQIQKQRDRIRKGSSKHKTDNDKQARSYFTNRTGRSAGKLLDALQAKLNKTDVVSSPKKIVQYRTSIAGHIQPKKLIATVEDISKSYNSRPILQHISLELRGRSRVYVSGGNGAGKSTLLKLIASRENPDSGSVKYGKDISVGYYAQDADGLDMDKSLVQHLNAFTKDQETALYESGKAIGLSKSQLTIKIGQLSRGQRSKAAILELLINRYDLLILDEPTNHLDIKTREVLEEALSRFEGSVVFASHDRTFVDVMTNDLSRQIELT